MISSSIKIIDNRKIDMTDDEWQMYVAICRSYDRPSFKGEELFRELFESDDKGRIVFLKPPSTRHTSMEVFMFISIIFQHQHIRFMHSQFDALWEKVKFKIDELEKIKKELTNKI
jgi:hypothetical protein